MKRLATSAVAALLVVLMFWVGGFDLNERGTVAFLCLWLSLGAAAATYLYPEWEEE